MSYTGISISLRPKFSGSLKLGCAPMATPFATAQRTQSRMAVAPPACQPQAIFAELTRSSSASSVPMPSPRSAFRSISIFVSCSFPVRLPAEAFRVHRDRPFDLFHIHALFRQRVTRGFDRCFDKAHTAVEPRLRELPQVGLDDRAYFWISAGGLGIAHQHDRLTVRRYLNRAWQHRVGQQVGFIAAFQDRPGEPETHAVTVRRDRPLLVPEVALGRLREGLVFGSAQYADWQRP